MGRLRTRMLFLVLIAVPVSAVGMVGGATDIGLERLALGWIGQDAPVASPEGDSRSDAGREGGPDLRLHLRLSERGNLLFSSWQAEEGALQDGPGDGRPLNTSLDEIPDVLAPIADLLRSVPGATFVEANGVRVPSATREHAEIRSTIVVARDGVLPLDDAASWFIDEPKSGVYRLGGIIPIVAVVEGDYLAYAVSLNETIEGNVPRTEGLFFRATPLEDRTIRVELLAPDGTFVSEGCRPVPGTQFAPGLYVVAEDGGVLRGERYASPFEFALQGRTVDVEVTIIEWLQ